MAQESRKTPRPSQRQKTIVPAQRHRPSGKTINGSEDRKPAKPFPSGGENVKKGR